MSIFPTEKFRKFLGLLVGFAFLLQNTAGWCAGTISTPSIASSTASELPVSVHLNAELKGLFIDSKQPLSFQFLIMPDRNNPLADLKSESLTLAKYFLSALAVPGKDLWVNLSPMEPDRIVPEAVGQTSLGQDLLLEDYFLKRLTSSLLNPETETGRKFWERIYQTLEDHGAADMDVKSWHKIWIVPAGAQMTETAQGVVITDARLKVMLEEDYVAQRQFLSASSVETGLKPVSTTALKNDNIKQILRSIIIPVIEDEVNHGESFAVLRQIYAAVLLADWYKHKLHDSLLGARFAGRSQTAGLEGIRSVQTIYESYLKIFRSGAFDLIREEYDASSQTTAPIHYFTGGANFTDASSLATIGTSAVPEEFYTRGQIAGITVNPAMLTIDIDRMFELHQNEPLAQQVSSLQKLLEQLKAEGRNTPHDIAEFEQRLNQLKAELRSALEKQAYKTHVYEFKERYYYNLIYTLVHPNSNLITFRQFVEQSLLPFLKRTQKSQILIAVSGKAASGKTTLAEILLNLKNYVRGIKNFSWDVLMLSYDDYMLEKEDRDPGHEDPESPYAKSQNERFNKDVEKLKNNQNVWTPIYDQTAKGQLKIGLDDDGQAVIFNGNVRMVFVRENGSVTIQIRKSESDAQDRRTQSGEILQTIVLEHDAPITIKAFGGLAVDCAWYDGRINLSFAHSRHALILPDEGDDRFFYQAEGKDNVELVRGEKVEVLRYIPQLETHKKRVIIFEGFMTLTAASYCDFTVNVETSSPIRIWRSILREISRGRRDEIFLREHLHTLLKRELSEDTLIDRLTLAARERNKGTSSVHFDIINYSVAEMFASEFLNRGILQGSVNHLSKQMPDAREIISQLDGIRIQALIEWLKKQLAGASVNFQMAESQQLHSETEQNRNWHTVQIDGNVLIGFVWDESSGGSTEVPKLLEDIHQRSRGPVTGFNILDVSRENIFITVSIGQEIKTIPLGRVVLIESLPSIGESLQMSGGQPGTHSEEWNRVKLKTPESWIDQFFIVQKLLWQRGLVDFEPSPYNYGIKNFDDRLVLMLTNFSSIVEDKHALRKLAVIARTSYRKVNKEFYQTIIGSIQEKRTLTAVKRLSQFQLRFLGNPETGENYLEMIPEKYRAYYIDKIWTDVPKDVREMNHTFGRVWARARTSAGSSAKDDTPIFRNQGIPTFDVYDSVIRHLSQKLEDIFQTELQKTFLRTYQSAKSAPAAGQTPRQQWLMDVYLNQNRNSFDYISAMTNVLLEKMMENPDWLTTEFDKTASDADILQKIWGILGEHLGQKNLPLKDAWKEVLLERIISFARKLPESWEDVRKVQKKSDDAMMLSGADAAKGGVDLSLETAFVTVSKTSGGFQPVITSAGHDLLSFDNGISVTLTGLVPARTFPREYILGL